MDLELVGIIDGDENRKRVDRVHFSVIQIDADVDSDNTETQSPYPPGPTDEEDRIEQRAGEQGRFVKVNDDDDDKDAVVDYWDGWSWSQFMPESSANAAENDFARLVLKINGPVDLATARVDVEYVHDGFPYSPSQPFTIWRRVGSESRVAYAAQSGAGDIIRGTFDDLGDLNADGGPTASMEFYIEAQEAPQSLGDGATVTVKLDPTPPHQLGYVHEDTIKVTPLQCKINWPKTPVAKSDNTPNAKLADTFVYEDGCYRQSNQAVAESALGELEQKRLYRVEGAGAPTGLDFDWELEPATVGTLLDTVDPFVKDHDPPDTVASGPLEGTLRLHARHAGADIGILHEVPVQVFKDHLSRDEHNFHHEKHCHNHKGGIQLSDSSHVAGTSLTCGDSVSHAAIGKPEEFRDLRGGAWGYGNQGFKTWAQFTTLTVKREDFCALRVRRDLNQDGEPDPPSADDTFMHAVTVISGTQGSTASTWGGDSMSKEFRVGTVRDYLEFFWGLPGTDHFKRDESDFNVWLSKWCSVEVVYAP